MLDLGKILLARIQELREESGGKIDINNIDDIIASLMETIKGHVATQNDVHLYNEMEKIADQIKVAKQEVVSASPAKISDDYIPGATLELSAVTKATEQATNIILDAAEEIQNLAGGLADKETGNKIIDNVTKIFEASNFQDLTGQRINKVITTLTDIEERIGTLIKAFSSTSAKAKKIQNDDPDSKLLNGPQMEAPSQDEIDDLFNRA